MNYLTLAIWKDFLKPK